MIVLLQRARWNVCRHFHSPLACLTLSSFHATLQALTKAVHALLHDESYARNAAKLGYMLKRQGGVHNPKTCHSACTRTFCGRQCSWELLSGSATGQSSEFVVLQMYITF